MSIVAAGNGDEYADQPKGGTADENDDDGGGGRHLDGAASPASTPEVQPWLPEHGPRLLLAALAIAVANVHLLESHT